MHKPAALANPASAPPNLLVQPRPPPLGSLEPRLSEHDFFFFLQEPALGSDAFCSVTPAA
eukprot:COSAG04_NODE_911_length_9469_cov_11.221025_6_plen_59_part_01